MKKQPFQNWFVAERPARLDLTVGTMLFTGRGNNATAGEYVVSEIEQVDYDTVQITVKRSRRS